MSSVLHPVGPEPRERYWVRRVGLLAAILVALSIVIALVVNATSAGSAVQAGEPIAPVVPAAAPTTSSPSPASPTTSPSASPTASASATPTKTPEPSATPTSKATEDSKTSNDSGKKSASTKKSTAPVLAACPNASLRATITGTPSPKVASPTTFSLSLINGSKLTCVLKVYGGNATVTVVSGSDRIWTSNDCSTSVPQSVTTLKPEQAVTWKVTWNGQRSKSGCQNRPETPRPGYYWAISTFADLAPVRTRLVVHS